MSNSILVRVHDTPGSFLERWRTGFKVERVFSNYSLHDIIQFYDNADIMTKEECCDGEITNIVYMTLNKGQYWVLSFDDYSRNAEQCIVSEITETLTDYLNDASIYNAESRGICRCKPEAFYSCIIDYEGNIVWQDDADEDWVTEFGDFITYDEYDEPIFKEHLPSPIKWSKAHSFRRDVEKYKQKHKEWLRRYFSIALGCNNVIVISYMRINHKK
jgi:hypothetical protein